MNNTVILIGRITKDLEIRYTTSGKAVLDFTLAVDRDKESADFIRIQCWNKTAEAISRYCQKGDMMGVRGSWRHDVYEDKDGNKRSSDYVSAQNVMFLQTKKKEEKASNPFEEFAEEIQNEDLPF